MTNENIKVLLTEAEIKNRVIELAFEIAESIDDDWLVWLTARGRVYARNEASSQQEYISRGISNKFFCNFNYVFSRSFSYRQSNVSRLAKTTHSATASTNFYNSPILN